MPGQSNATSRRLTDAQLISARFRYAQPESAISELNRGVPDPEANPTIIGFYDETPVGGRASNPDFPFVRCCHCGTRRHWKGHVIRDDKGETYIIGASKCGKEHYGIRYESAERAFKAEKERQGALIRWSKMLKILPSYSAEVKRLITSSELGALDVKRDELYRASPLGFHKLAQIASTGDPMFEHIEERDHIAEAEREKRYRNAMVVFEAKPKNERKRLQGEGLAPERDTDPIYKRVSTPLGHLVGGSFLTDRGDVRKYALELRSTIENIDAIEQQGTETARTTELTRLLQEMANRPKKLGDVIREASFTSAFFQDENLDRIGRWSNGERRFSFGRQGDDLIVEDASKGIARIKPIGEFNLPYSDAMSMAHYLDEDFEPMMVAAAE